MSTTRRFVVIGHPVSHSLSPQIHARFASATGIALEYTTLLAPLGEFDASAHRFFAGGGSGANVTLPFKIDALRFADEVSARARLAGAANVLTAREGRIAADNTDGAGLVADLTRNLGLDLRGKRVLLVGAGGAARGVIAPLLALAPATLVIANRTVERADALAREFAALGPIRASALEAIEGAPFDLVLNATSTSTKGESLELPGGTLATGATVYDMAYGPPAHAFLERSRRLGARACDGLGMLVEQAAEAFEAWHGRRPDTAPVLAALRASR
jgi:shikimate dehydrogenase